MKALARVPEALRVHTWETKEATRILAEDVAIALSERYAGPKAINRYRSQVFSQNREDGIIAAIFERIGIGARVFVEVGVGDGRECNTRLLLMLGWSGFWIEADSQACRSIAERFRREIGEGRLKVIEAIATRENIDPLLEKAGCPPSVDLLSIDVDMNTYWVWEGINRRTRVAIIEYNASFPPTYEWVVPYEPMARWDGSNYFGASLKSLELLGRRKQMALVGCDYHGVNAFFVSSAEKLELFSEPFTAEHHYEPPRYQLLSHRGHRPMK